MHALSNTAVTALSFREDDGVIRQQPNGLGTFGRYEIHTWASVSIKAPGTHSLGVT